MELLNKLKSIFNTDSIIELQKNTEFGFTINWIKATKENPYHLIFTSGLSDKKQTVSEKYPEFETIELYFCLPKYWKVDHKSSEYSWPIEWLNKIAQVPQKNNTWFGPGDTIPTGNPAKPISTKMIQNHFILAEPIKLETELKEVEIGSKSIRFLSVIPIYEQEMAFKTRNSATILMSKFQYSNYNEEIDEYRPTTVKFKKFNMVWIVVILLSIAFGITAFFRVYNSTDSEINNSEIIRVEDSLI